MKYVFLLPPRKILCVIWRAVLIWVLVTGSLSAAEPALQLNGVEGDLEENIQNTVDLSRFACDEPDWRLDRLQKRILRQTHQALEALGYYDAKIDQNITHSDDCWGISLSIAPGEPVRITSLQVEVEGGLSETEGYKNFQNKLPLKQGAVLNHGDYEKTKNEIEILASRYGFFQGEFNQRRLDIDPEKHSAEIELIYESGPRARFGTIDIDQQEYRDKFLSQFMVIQAGDPYDSQALTRQQQTLYSSGYFNVVEVDAQRDDTTAMAVPVRIRLQAVKKHAYRIGIGASTDIGPRASFKYDNRRINRLGHQFGVDTSYSAVRSEVTARYGIPQGKAGAERLDLQLGYLHEETDTTRSDGYKAALLRTRISSNDWINTAFLEYLYERFETADSDRLTRLLMPGYRIQKTVADNPIYPRNGWMLSSAVRAAFEGFLSDTYLTQLTVDGKLIKPLGKGRILSRVSAGATEVGDFEKLPVSLRFFAGGDSSVRGFDYKSLGPEDENGDVIGGKYLLSGSLEYEYPVFKEWGLAVFVDAGNAFNNTNDYDIHTGAGLGVRWHSPIGPIRLDVAKDVSGEEDIRFHLSMGLDL